MVLNLFDNYPNEYFDGSSQMKKEFTKELMSSLNPDELLIKAKTEVYSLIDSSEISNFSKDFCKACFASAPDEFFILPTSTTGKYHGGRTSLENSVGGNIIHTKNVLGLVPKVLNRYKELLTPELPELLRVSCILHDICKIPSGSIYTIDTHGELGAELINKVWEQIASTITLDLSQPIIDLEPVKFAVSNHMYLWKFINVWDQIQLVNECSSELLVGLMLSECDYYSR